MKLILNKACQFGDKNGMKQNLHFVHVNTTAREYVKQRYQDPDVDKQLITSNNYVLNDWIFKEETRCSIKYTMNVKWSEPVQQVLSKSEVTVSEKRNFDFDSNPIKISSTISTNFKYLKATIIRTLTDSNNNCTEDISINIIYSGDCYKKEIERSFFLALQPLIITEAKAPLFADNASLEHFQIYHNLHDELEQLKNLSSSFNNIIEQTKIDRKPLVVPSADQISQIINIVSYEKFSIQDEIDQMRAETDRMNRIVGSIKKARQQTIGSSSLPIFIMASCAALIAIVISRSKK